MMKLDILTPETTFFSGEADSITLPGASGSFQILNHHAPIVALLTKGILSFSVNGIIRQVQIADGVVEMHDNKVIVCVEPIPGE